MTEMGYGDGGTTRRKDGRLQVAVSVAGRRRYVMIPARMDPREAAKLAERKRRDLQAMRDAEVDPSGQTLAAYLRSWISGLREARHRRVRPRTLDHYAMIVERHIIPALGDLPLSRVTSRRIQAWIDADPASPQTVHHHRAVLRRALNIALRQQVIARNPAITVELPPVEGEHGAPLTFTEAARLLRATTDDRLNPLWHLAIVTGLRQGELLGLAWDDLDGEVLTVRAQLQRREGAWVRGKTKAARTLDSLLLDADTLEVLAAHRTRQAAERRPEWRYFGMMFVTPLGNPYQAAEVLRAFHRACDAAGIARRRFHDLRFTNSTLMRERGIPEDLRMARQGHVTVTMARRYAKTRPGLDRVAAEAIADGLREAQ